MHQILIDEGGAKGILEFGPGGGGGGGRSESNII